MDMIICSGKLELFAKAIASGLEESQVPVLSRHVQERLVAYLASVNGRSSPYYVWVKNCSELLVMFLNWVEEEAKTRKEKELIEAICVLDVERICYLLEMEELNINYQDRRGYTPLMWAVAMGDLAIVIEILRRNPDRGLKNKEDKTALDIAKQNPNVDIIDALERWKSISPIGR
jgi:hypothetical protein